MKKVDHNTLQDILYEIRDQPPWRSQADREMDYCDGNQLDTLTLQAQAAIGIPPIKENLMGPAFEDMSGQEKKSRTDWKVESDDDEDTEGEKVAKALSYKLFQAERRSGCDQALTDAFMPLAKVGIGWVEVCRENDPFRYPYKVRHIHRNEIWKDWYAKEKDLSDARWLLRRKWVNVDVAAAAMPKFKELILGASSGFGNLDDLSLSSMDTGASTNLQQAEDIQRGWSVEEQEWMDPNRKRICFFQLLTREYTQAIILRMSNGRVVEFDLNNPMHVMAVTNGFQIEKRNISKIYDTLFLGPHALQSKQSEFSRFNFVQFIGKQEDRTNIPYGTARWLMPLQDELNVRVSKMTWALSARRTRRTRGATELDDEQLREMQGRLDADIVLVQKEMAKPGAVYEVDDNRDVSSQQYQRITDLREIFAHISGISKAASGDANPNNSGAMAQAIEQSVQSQVTTSDAHSCGRKQVGELLMELIIKDIGQDKQQVKIKGNALKEPEVIVLNHPAVDQETGQQYLTNDVQRTMLRVALDDVPSTPSFRAQSLSSLTEFAKSLPPQYQAVLLPHIAHLSNIPNNDEIVKSIVEINKNGALSPEQVKQQTLDAVEQAKIQWMVDQKNRELDIREKESTAKIEQISVKNVLDRIATDYSAIQAAIQAITYKQAAPVADQFLLSAGAQDQDKPPILAAPQEMPISAPIVPENTSPMFPPKVQEPGTPHEPIPQEEPIASPGVGMQRGIEEQGVQ